MRARWLRSCGAPLLLAALIVVPGCNDDTIDNDGGTGGSADIDVTLSTPNTGDTNISGIGVTITKQAFTGNGSGGYTNGVLYTRLIVAGTTAGHQRQVLVDFETTTGVLNIVRYSWGFANLFEHSVYCPLAGCAGVVVATSAKTVFFTSTALDNHPPITEVATLDGSIQYE